MEPVTSDPITLVYHELRAPLALLATAARAAAEDCHQDDVRQRLDVILHATERMLRTTEQVMRVASARSELEMEAIHPVDVAANVAADMAGLGANIGFFASESSREAVSILAQGQLEALLTSLLSNARDHSQPGTRICVAVVAVEDDLRLTISNITASNRRHRGLGLGSHICRTLASDMGLGLDLAISGDTFTAAVQIPIASARGTSPAMAVAEHRPAQPRRTYPNPRTAPMTSGSPPSS